MLNNITWQGYWVTLALLSAGYYLIIYAVYFRNDFKIIIPKKNKDVVTPSAAPPISSFLKEQAQPNTFKENLPVNDKEHSFHASTDELIAYLEGSKKAKVVKEEFLYAVQHILSKYPALKGSEYQEPISKLIVSEAEHTCSIHLNEEDVIHVWLDK